MGSNTPHKGVGHLPANLNRIIIFGGSGAEWTEWTIKCAVRHKKREGPPADSFWWRMGERSSTAECGRETRT
jgi:hypothetical protein